MSRFPLSLIVFGLILGVSLLISSWLVVQGMTYIKTYNDSQIDVTGSSRRVVSSDRVKWVAQLVRTTPADELSAGYDTLHDDLEGVLRELETQGFAAGEVVVSPVMLLPVYRECNFELAPDCERGVVAYDLQQTLTLNSERVAEVTALAQDVRPFMGRGMTFSTQGLEYYFSGLPELRVELLAAAVRDAQARALAIAESTGAGVGALQSVDSGVFQVTQVNSTEVSGYGVYDTSTIEKEVSAVVHARFGLQR